MRKNSKEYFINIIRTNANEGIQFLRTVEKPNGVQKIAYDQSHDFLNYFGLSGGKKYPLSYLKEQAEYSVIVLNALLSGKRQEGFIC
jgi:hypothetical protein